EIDVLRLTPGAGPGEIAAIVSLVDCLLVLQPTTGRTRFHGQGLVVDDLDASLAALAEARIGAVGELEDLVLLDPSALPVPTYLGARLLPEDPRLA
ncbi:MAG TPA: hypothetical protein VGF22_00515, partial [Acidimicrobiales bacterium]